MSLAAWVAEFRTLHDKAKAGKLLPGEKRAYETQRAELARAMVSAQRLTLKEGETPREALRVARALQIDLDLEAGKQRTITVDLSIGGFAVLLGVPPKPHEKVGFALKIPGAENPLTGRALFVDSKKQPSNFRVSFHFQDMSAEDRDKVEMVVIDSALDKLAL
jgi:hypothetical protein